MGGVKFATSVGHLESVGQQANEYLRLKDSDIGWPLDELWVGSELLDGPAEIEATPLVLVLDVPPENLPWLALHPAGDWICEQLRLTKRPISWRYRSTVYPAWNCRDRQVPRFWSSDAGDHTDVIEGLRARHFDQLQIVAPGQTEFAAQLQTELDLCRYQLKDNLDQYWDAEWRQQHKGFGIYPDDDADRATPPRRRGALDPLPRRPPRQMDPIPRTRTSPADRRHHQRT
jgi:hypothetical protein